MTTIDFSRSFLTFRIDTLRTPPATVTHPLHLTLNNARIAIDCRCGIVDNTTSGNYEFVLGASCKTERVRVPRDIWTEPNADFVPVFSHDRFLTIKTFDSATRQMRRTFQRPSARLATQHCDSPTNSAAGVAKHSRYATPIC